MLRYLKELRSCLLRGLYFFTGCFLALFPFSNKLYEIIAQPLLKQLPEKSSLIATGLIAPFWIPLKLTFFVALFLALPVFIYQVMRFITPALYRDEKKGMVGFLIASILLFYVGVLVAYFLIFPLFFKFLMKASPAFVLLMPDISQYLDLAMQLFLAFGLIFEMPVLVVFLISWGWVSFDAMTAKRPYVIVGAFIFAMVIGPADVSSQILLALPMCLLFEVGLLIARIMLYARRLSPAH